MIAELETLTREHPYRERLRGLLMLALYRSDRQAEALQAYQDARRQLVAELGIEPGEQLRELERAILAQDPALSLPVAAPVELPAELATGTPIVGRDGDLEWLRAQWRAAREAPGRLAAVVGARGMGKTRLVAELAAEVRREGASVLYLDGAGQPLAVPAVLDAARRAALVVLDDVDRAGEDVRAAIEEIVAGATERPLLLLATAEDEVLTARLGAAATRSLTPLGAAGVRAVAQLYAGPRADEDVPVELLLEASGGVPLRAHRVAAEWARAEAEGRLDAAAGRAASGRTDLREAEDELAGNVVELQAVRRRTARDAESGVVACPFKGLAAFDIEDARVFFGREQLVAEMVARLAGAPLMGVVGPSGSGKSSALRAGLLAALAAGVLPGSERWPLALLRPGEHPLAALDRATADAPRAGRMVVAVDQFEETFTACRDESERAAFVDALVTAARDPRRRALVLLAVRADFYGRCAAYPELARLLGACHVLVGAMRRAELRRAIELPAQVAGLRVEPELADALIADVEGEPGGLPLLSTALLELWQHRDGRVLRMSAYEHAGGVRGAVARLAERAYARLDPPRRELARRILLRLAEGDGDAVVRRRVPLNELDADARPARRRGARRCSPASAWSRSARARPRSRTRRCCASGRGCAAGSRRTPTARRLHRHLGAAAREWDAGGRDPGELYRGARLAAALDWAATHTVELNATERDFLDDSRARERARPAAPARCARGGGDAARAVRDRRCGGARSALQRPRRGDRRGGPAPRRPGPRRRRPRPVAAARPPGSGARRHRADAQQPAGGAAAHAGGDRRATRRRRRAGEHRPQPERPDAGDHRHRRHAKPVRHTHAASRSARDHARVFAAQGGGLRRGPGGPDRSRRAALSDDGTRLAVGGLDPAVLDARTRKLVMPKLNNVRYFFAVHFAPDGRTVLAGIAGPGREISTQRFAVASGRPIGAPRLITQRNVLATPMLTHDGTRVIITMTGRTEIRDATTLRVLQRWPAGADEAALSPDGHTLLLGERDGSVRFLDLGNGDARTASGRHAGPVMRATFGPDGRTAVTAGEDNRVIVWDARRAAITETLEGHAGKTTSLAISRDGRTLYTGALDGNVLIWDLIGEHRLDRRFRIGPLRPSSFSESLPSADRGGRAPRAFMSTALSRDGRILAAGHDDGTVSLFDVSTLRPISTFWAVPRGPVRGMGYIPHTRLLVVGGDGGFLGIFDPNTGRLVQRLPADRPRGAGLPQLTGLGTQIPPSFSADGRLMATADFGNNVLRWRMRAGRAVGTPRSYRPSLGTLDVSLSPDGRTMVVVAELGVEVVDVATLRRRADLPGASSVRSAQFTPDGRYVVGASYNGWARMWSTKTWQPVGPVLAGHTDAALSASVSPDGRTVATGSADGTIRLYDVATQTPVGAPLPTVPKRPVAPLFTPDGDYLLAITSARQAHRWDARPSAWAQRACAVAGRTLTRAEWNDALPGRTYAPACTT